MEKPKLKVNIIIFIFTIDTPVITPLNVHFMLSLLA
jgi:hypothetical protein